MYEQSGYWRIVGDVAAERTRQDKQWGGPEHDDTHNHTDWFVFIKYQADKQLLGNGANPRERLVKIAALALAGIESFDRLQHNPLRAQAPTDTLQAIPKNVYFAEGPAGGGNFYQIGYGDGKGAQHMGDKFRQQWFGRRDEFPTKRQLEAKK